MALNSGIQTYQILTNYDEVCIPSLFSILLAVHIIDDFEICMYQLSPSFFLSKLIGNLNSFLRNNYKIGSWTFKLPFVATYNADHPVFPSLNPFPFGFRKRSSSKKGVIQKLCWQIDGLFYLLPFLTFTYFTQNCYYGNGWLFAFCNKTTSSTKRTSQQLTNCFLKAKCKIALGLSNTSLTRTNSVQGRHMG